LTNIPHINLPKSCFHLNSGRVKTWEPAETFHEALQSLWMSHMLIMAAESYPGAGLSHGRFDQYIFPYFQADIEGGRLDEEQAKELLECYWIKHNYAYDFQCRVMTNQGINSGFGQLVTIGGIDADGNDASNRLTWLTFDVKSYKVKGELAPLSPSSLIFKVNEVYKAMPPLAGDLIAPRC
jgi:pyruvate-formate lyase